MNASRNQVIIGDVRDVLPAIGPESVDCVITSPPYFALRNYDIAGQIGLEPRVDAWVSELRKVIRDLTRVLVPTGSLWLNLGDTYSRDDRTGAPPKSLLLGPERLALAMLEDGWTIRNKVIWAKSNPMPSSVRDRLSCTWEVWYFCVRSRRYYFDLDAIRAPHTSAMTGASVSAARRAEVAQRPSWAGPLAGSNRGLDQLKARGRVGHPLGKNPGDVWRHATSSHPGVHHAMFPTDIARRPLLASCPEQVCTSCRQPWQRQPARSLGHLAVAGELRPACSCAASCRRGLVLDPFLGAGTTAIVAEQLGRDWLGIELNPEFARHAEQRIERARKRRGNNGPEPVAEAA
jgi:DNA modification methylase